MKFILRVIVHIAVLGSIAFLMMTAPASALTNVLALDIQGFRLGQTVDEIEKRYPSAKIEGIKPDKKTTMGYRIKVSEVHLYFTNDDLGKKLFRIQLLRIYPTKPDPGSIFKRLLAKYGRPDYSGRQMFHIHMCWGKCFGSRPRLEFRMKITSVDLHPYPMTLTLSDPKMEKQNRQLYLKKSHISN